MHALNDKKYCRGVSLVEVLVAMVVLSVGTLGLANLQLVGIQANHTGDQRVQATLLAAEIVDLVHANRASALAGNYNITADHASPTDPGCFGASASCSRTQQAASDLATWRAGLGNVLTGGSGAVLVNNPAGVSPSVTVTITWGAGSVFQTTVGL
ncbi:MAG TPA: type IV pilus modification protein PilV [Gemmatimonadales bacterium]|jgi:type IV pilus assembly protein PilV|nr:type IV pilus modification protein PilV [Gemmatimonadales bacterium]